MLEIKYDIGTAAKQCTTLYRRIMSALCHRDCNEGHCREEMMNEKLSGWWRLNRCPATNLAAFRWTCSTCLIWVCCWGFQIDQGYSSFGHTRVWYALSLTEVGHDFKLRLMNTSVCKALPVLIQKLADNRAGRPISRAFIYINAIPKRLFSRN